MAGRNLAVTVRVQRWLGGEGDRREVDAERHGAPNRLRTAEPQDVAAVVPVATACLGAKGEAMRRISQSVVAVALSVGALCAASVGTAAADQPPRGPTPTRSPAAGAPTGSSAAAEGHHPGRPRPWPGTHPCSWRMLRPALAGSEGAAGSTYLTITYTNIGRRSCVLKGFPTVAFVDRRGRLLGREAAHTTAPVKAVTLVPGGKAKFVVREVDAGLQVGCQDKRTWGVAAGLGIMAPGGGRPSYLSVGRPNVCLSRSVQQLSVGPVTG